MYNPSSSNNHKQAFQRYKNNLLPGNFEEQTFIYIKRTKYLWSANLNGLTIYLSNSPIFFLTRGFQTFSLYNWIEIYDQFLVYKKFPEVI